MSAAAAWDLDAVPVRIPVRAVRPRLISVPCGDEPAAATTALRLTRAGRLAITATGVAVIVAVAIAVFSSSASATLIDHATTVQSGQTLSGIAAQQLPGLPIAEAVARIEVANNLVSSDIHAGQTLLIPAVR